MRAPGGGRDSTAALPVFMDESSRPRTGSKELSIRRPKFGCQTAGTPVTAPFRRGERHRGGMQQPRRLERACAGKKFPQVEVNLPVEELTTMREVQTARTGNRRRRRLTTPSFFSTGNSVARRQREFCVRRRSIRSVGFSRPKAHDQDKVGTNSPGLRLPPGISEVIRGLRWWVTITSLGAAVQMASFIVSSVRAAFAGSSCRGRRRRGLPSASPGTSEALQTACR